MSVDFCCVVGVAVGVALFISLLCVLFGNEWLFYTRAQLYEDTVTCRSDRYIIELPEKKTNYFERRYAGS